MFGFLLISFVAGILTVLAPCVLPLLPIIVGGSVAGETHWRRALAVVGALAASVFLFTILLKASTAFIAIPALFWQIFSGGLLLIFGLVTLAPKLWDRLPGVGAIYRKANLVLGSGYQRQGAWGDIIIGAALGPVFSSCSPTYFVILAAVLPVQFAAGTLYLVAYCLGMGIFLLIIALAGQKVVDWLGIASNPNGWFKKAIGILFLLVGLAVIFGYDKKLEASLPSSAFGEIGIEQQLLGNQPSSSNQSSSTETVASSTFSKTSDQFLTPAQKATVFQKAPELAGIAGYINTSGQPVTLAQYRGKNVVLIDFWDYSCINCQRTTPYLNAWYKKYKDQGLVIIGVHTPEFAFEQLPANVQAAVTAAGIEYPVVLDNQYQTWRAFNNEYWPREYLIDIDGYVVYNHIGEGNYDESEHEIQRALSERASRLGVSSSGMPTSVVSLSTPDLSAVQSPETYFGASRNQYLANGVQGANGPQSLSTPTTLRPNSLYLGGTWNFLSEYAETGAGGKIIYTYTAHDVYMVAATPGTGMQAKIKILRDGQPLGTVAGADVHTDSEAAITGDRLYKLIHDSSVGTHTIEIDVESGTLDAYTLTFG